MMIRKLGTLILCTALAVGSLAAGDALCTMECCAADPSMDEMVSYLESASCCCCDQRKSDCSLEVVTGAEGEPRASQATPRLDPPRQSVAAVCSIDTSEGRQAFTPSSTMSRAPPGPDPDRLVLIQKFSC